MIDNQILIDYRYNMYIIIDKICQVMMDWCLKNGSSKPVGSPILKRQDATVTSAPKWTLSLASWAETMEKTSQMFVSWLGL